MPQSSSLNDKTCQRCKEPFICNPADIIACGCKKVYLTGEELNYVSTLYSDCVCNTCLLHLKNEFLSH